MKRFAFFYTVMIGGVVMVVGALSAFTEGCSGRSPTAAPVEFGGAVDACQRYATGMGQFQHCRAETIDVWCGDAGLLTHADGGQCAAIGAP